MVAQSAKKRQIWSHCNPPMEVEAQNHNTGLTLLLGSLNSFLNGITQPGNTNDHRGDKPQEKGLDAGQVLPCVDLTPMVPYTGNVGHFLYPAVVSTFSLTE